MISEEDLASGSGPRLDHSRLFVLVHWDDPEGWDGEGGGRGVQDGEYM